MQYKYKYKIIERDKYIVAPNETYKLYHWNQPQVGMKMMFDALMMGQARDKNTKTILIVVSSIFKCVKINVIHLLIHS